MDQLKVFLKQCVKYRFWIAVVISLLLPIIGYFVGAGAINTVTTAREGEIKNAKTEIAKYTTPGIVNNQYQPLAATKKDALVQDVDATWQKLFANQEPLLKWPPEVQDRFRKWGRKYPTDVDKSQVRSTIIDYTVSYPDFVDKIYAIFKPFNFEDGSGIVVADEPNVLLQKATYSQDSPPDLTKIWAEQERLWVVTALLDVVGKVNDSVGATDWDRAIIKRIKVLEVGAASDQDQKSIAKGDTLVPADVLSADGTTAAAPPPPAPAMGGEGGAGRGGMGMGMGMGMAGGGQGEKSNEVLYLKTDSLKYKILPIKMTVQVDQARLPDFLTGLENSPMAIQVNEVEISKPLTPVEKPAYGERANFSSGGMGMGMMGGRQDEMMMGGPGGRGRPMGGGMGRAGAGAGGSNTTEMMMGGRGAGSGGGAAAKPKAGVDNRSKNDAQARKDQAKKDKDTAKAKSDTKKIDQYYNVIDVTVYGQARFFLAPPAPVTPDPSTAPAPPTEAPKPEAPATPPAQPPAGPEVPKAEAPKVDEAKPEAPKAEAPAPKDEAAKGEAPTPKP